MLCFEPFFFLHLTLQAHSLPSTVQHPDSYAKAECIAKVKGCLMPNVKCPTFSKHAGSVYRGRADNDLLQVIIQALLNTAQPSL